MTAGILGSTPQATCHPERKMHAKGMCRQCYQKAYAPRANELRIGKDRSAENHTPKAKKRRKNWQQENRDKANASARVAHIRNLYSMTIEQYEAKLLSQNNICALCGGHFSTEYLGGKDPVLDHSHKSGKIREFIHRICNTALGQLQDDPAICRLAAQYLERHEEILT